MIQHGSNDTIHRVFTAAATAALFARFEYRLDELVGHIAIENKNQIKIRERNMLTSQILINSALNHGSASVFSGTTPGQT